MFDNFPEAFQTQRIDSWIVPGAIVRIDCSWFVDKPNPVKYVVMVAHDPCLVFMVNTDLRYSPDVSTQVELRESEYPGMIDHNCWINCNAALDDVTIAEIKRQVKANPQCYRGRLKPAEVRTIIHAMAHARGIAPRQQKAILAAMMPLAA
jgi:hypothetical protein